MKIEQRTLRQKVLLSVQQALLGRVTPNLRVVAVGWHTKLIRIHCLFDGVVSDDDHTRMEELARQVIGDFPADFDYQLVVEQCDPGIRPDQKPLGEWIYWRYELL